MSGASPLSRRERQIMDILHRKAKATSAEIREAMADPPSYSAVRAMLRILEDKGHVTHEQDGLRYVFVPTEPPEQARRNALRHLLTTFFEGSAERAVAALLDGPGQKLKPEELERLGKLIDEAKRKGR